MAKFDPDMGDPHGDPQTSPQHACPHGLGAFLKKTIQEIHVDRRVVGWSAGLHVDHPCRGQISPWPARKVTENPTRPQLSSAQGQMVPVSRGHNSPEKGPSCYTKMSSMSTKAIPDKATLPEVPYIAFFTSLALMVRMFRIFPLSAALWLFVLCFALCPASIRMFCIFYGLRGIGRV